MGWGEGCVRFSSCCVIRLLKLGLESLFFTTVSKELYLLDEPFVI